MNEIKLAVKSRTVWAALIVGLVRLLEEAEIIPSGLADPLQTIFGALAVIFLRLGVVKR